MGPLHPDDPVMIGGHRILGRIGAGGMGAVYLAEDGEGGRVAVKTIRAELVRDEDGTVPARFRREIAMLRRLGRRCTAALLDADPDADPPYLVIEYIPGPSLAEQVKRHGPLRTDALQEAAVGIAAALEHVHAEGIVHRDLKPANVLLGPHGPRVIDFGLALLAERGTRITATGLQVGTPPFMAPEQLLGHRVTPSTDLFAWAGTMVHAASGAPPFGEDHRTLHARILEAEPVVRGIDGPLLPLVMRALSKDPAARPTAAEIVAELRSLAPSRTVLGNAAAGTVRLPAPAPEHTVTADDPDGWAELAGRSVAAGKTRLAAHQAERGLALDPLHARCLLQRARASIAEGRNGLPDLRLAHEVAPDDTEVTSAYIRALLTDGTVESARKAHELAPGDAPIRTEYAWRLSASGRRADVIKAFKLAPGDAEIAARYRRLAKAEASATDISPAALRAVLRVKAALPEGHWLATGPVLLVNMNAHDTEKTIPEVVTPQLDLDRLTQAVERLAQHSEALPQNTQIHLGSLLAWSLQQEIYRNSLDYSAERGRRIADLLMYSAGHLPLATGLPYLASHMAADALDHTAGFKGSYLSIFVFIVVAEVFICGIHVRNSENPSEALAIALIGGVIAFAVWAGYARLAHVNKLARRRRRRAADML